MKDYSIIFCKCIPVALCCFTFNSNAQFIETTTLKKSVEKSVQFSAQQNIIKNAGISYKSFIIPSLLIAYGFTTIKSDGLSDINEEIKEEIWTENPHVPLHIDNYLQFLPAAAVYGLNIVGIKGKHDFIDRTVSYLLSNLFLNASVLSFKTITRQQRPDGSSYNSFPSGHTTEAFASAEFLRQEYNNVSPWYGIAGYAVATTTGLLRMYNNKHWLSDVVSGAGFGIASAKLAYWLYPVIKKKFSTHKDLHAMAGPYYNDRSLGISCIYIFNK